MSREQGAEEKHFRELGRKVIFLSGSREQRPPPPWWGLMELLGRMQVSQLHNVYFKPCPTQNRYMEVLDRVQVSQFLNVHVYFKPGPNQNSYAITCICCFSLVKI